jgi:hypothetical protein
MNRSRGRSSDYQRREATVWIDGLDKINKLRRINFCVDLSATPYFIGRVGQATNTIFPWTVSDFGLTDAIESGLVKIPQFAVRDTTGREMPEYFNLWHHILKKLTPAESGGKIGQYLFLRHGGKIVFFGRFVALLRTFAAMLAGANRMSPPFFLVMNALGGICWAVMFGGGAYLIGEEIDRVTGPVSLLFVVVAIGLVAAGVIYFRRHERELEQRAEIAIPGSLFGAPANRPHGQ